MTDEQRELERCRKEISRLKELVVRLTEIIVRNVVEGTERTETKKE